MSYNRGNYLLYCMKITFDFGCIYFFKSINEELLYIGKTYSLKNRFSQHLSDPDEWKKDIYYVEYLAVENEVDRDILETYCINLYKPIYNKDKVFGNIRPTLQIELPKKEVALKAEILATINKRNIIGNFKECCLEYIESLESRESISEIYPLIKEAFEKLGIKKIKALEFVQKDIQNHISTEKALVDFSSEILSFLNLEIGQLVDKAEIKKKLQSIYDILKINKLAKATDLFNWYVMKDQNKKINNKGIVMFKLQSYKEREVNN